MRHRGHNTEGLLEALLIREGTGAGHGIDTDLGLAHESALKEAETDAMKRALVTFGNPFGLALYDKSQRQVTGAPSGQGQTQPRGTQPRQATPAQRPQPQAQRPPANSNQATQRPQANGSQRPLQRHPCGTPPRGNGAHGQGSSTPQATARPQAPATRAPAASAPTATRPSASPAAASANGHQSQSTGPDALLEPAIALQLQEQLKALSPRHRDPFSRAFRTAFRVPDSTPSVAGLIRRERHRIWIQEFLAQATRG